MAKESTIIGVGLLVGLSGVIVMGISSASAISKKTYPSPTTQQVAGVIMTAGLLISYLGWQKGIPLTK